MKELPKELTPKLLSLVLNDIHISNLHMAENILQYKSAPLGFEKENLHINIDTLTRLMKEYSLQQGVEIISGLSLIHKTGIAFIQDGSETIYINPYRADTEFEAVLKATHWVATEKGLICND